MSEPKKQAYPKEIVSWMMANYRPESEFMRFLGYVETRMKNTNEAALQPGDTDFHKGKLAAFRQILRLPEQILKSGTDADTEETAPKA